MPYNVLGDIETLELSNAAAMDNACCILTLNCTVQLMGNVTLTSYAADATIATLPESMRPMSDVVVPVYLGARIDATIPVLLSNTLGLEADVPDLNLVPLRVDPDGVMSMPIGADSGTLYLNGVEFNVCDRYYNASIGNNFSQGTSPLR